MGGKTIIIVLVLLALLFAASMALSLREEKPRDRQKEEATKGEGPGWMDFLGNLGVGPPTVKLNRSQYPLNQGKTFEETVPPSSETFRLLKLKIPRPSPVLRVVVTFDAAEPPPLDDMEEQEFTFPREGKTPWEGTVTVFKSGGKLKIRTVSGSGTLTVE